MEKKVAGKQPQEKGFLSQLFPSKSSQILAFFLMNLFFWMYYVWDNSLINLACKAFFISLIYKKTKKEDKQSQVQEIDDRIKGIYIALYVMSNKALQYIRNIIELKVVRTSLVRTFVFLEVSVTCKYLGDKLSLWLVFLSFFLIPYMMERRKKTEPSQGVEGGKPGFMDKIKGFGKKIWLKIPKYSDLDKKNN